MSRAALAAALRALHVPGDPVVLPNVWDAASARVVAAAFPAVATASAAVSASLGFPDGEGLPADEAFAAVARVVRAVDVPVTADVERGYRLPPAEIAARLADAGAVGCNLEDSDPATSALLPLAEQVEFLGAVRAADPDLVLNARVDVFLRPDPSFEAGVERGRAYLAAGADCVYPIGLAADRVAEYCRAVAGPVNLAHVPGGPTPAGLGALGVARVSFGPGLHRLLTARLEALVAGIREGGSPYRP
ncbi:isocitrate lyase/phosphoenolpyruvate mutase family protein [Actinosynnema sp. NPDC047251]|uniref:Phosphorylmutase n=1 Tax=Saccharothrix espanaensis (strain ATCC 51144 / DSM 44229 / JCM 9112 / NBRC 15066 / NRRL 15764) TaxID=1179773 RepID=K0K3M8_SACES|nr:isocitrate lyase/phosphoenolpyruvate mutase family protein [Saccharothrix espanaensis]CCH31484.1 Phosphorylmutase [Saccharothrix espanaensis DSM 44229]